MAVNDLNIAKKKADILEKKAIIKEIEQRSLVEKTRELRLLLGESYMSSSEHLSDIKFNPVLRGSDRKTVRLKMLELIKQF